MRENSWETRRDRGWPWKTDVLDYIATVYAQFLGAGLIQAHLAADKKLYWALHGRLNEMTPEEKSAALAKLKLPKESDAVLDALPDDDSRSALIEARKLNKESNRLLRMIKAKQLRS